MVITIIGSLKNKHKMEYYKKFFENMGHTVHSPSDQNIQNLPLIAIQTQWIKNIEESDLVVAIPKEVVLNDSAGKTTYTYEFGESTSYELAIAHDKDKSVVSLV